jgi:hypothetical protein
MSVDLLNQYMDPALTFERLAKTEANTGLKADLKRQADAYRRLAAKCAGKPGLPPRVKECFRGGCVSRRRAPVVPPQPI